MSEPDPLWRGLGDVYEAFAAAEPSPGLVFGVVGAGGEAHLQGVGLADLESRRQVTPQTAFRIASMTKCVTALAILKLRDEGRLQLDAPLASYVPAFADAAPPPGDSAPVRIRDLLTHMAGFVSDDPWADRRLGATPAEFDEIIARGELFARPPGVAFEYSNLGYALLGRAVANVVGRSYQAYVREALLAPLGMASTSFSMDDIPPERRATGYRRAGLGWSPEVPEPDGEFAAMGGLVTTAADYARFVAFLLDAWPPRDAPEPDLGPVRRASRRELAACHAPPWPPFAREAEGRRVHVASAYGYGLVDSVDDELGRYLHHSGGLPGWGSHVLLAPGRGVAIFAFANHTYAPVHLANLAAAEKLNRDGGWRPRAGPASSELLAASAAVREAWRSADIESVAGRLADNLLRDQPAAERNAQLAALKARLGDAADIRLEPRHARAARFELTAERGAVGGELVLTPGPDPTIQLLSFDDA